jgi:hypothetical protein
MGGSFFRHCDLTLAIALSQFKFFFETGFSKKSVLICVHLWFRMNYETAPYSALAKGRFYLFFIRLGEFFVTLLCGAGSITSL